MIRVDRELLTKVKAELGISLPVRIEFGEQPADLDIPDMEVEPGDELLFGGCAETSNGKHTILLARGRPPRWYSFGALHELTHCAQRERIGDVDAANRLYTMFDQLAGYEHNPLEREANETAERLLPRYRGLVYKEER